MSFNFKSISLGSFFEPFVSSFYGVASLLHQNSQNYEAVSDKDLELSRQINQNRLMPEEVSSQVKKFLNSQGILNAEKILFLEAEDDELACAQLEEKNVYALVLSKKICEEIKKEFSNKHKFIIAHEAGHIVNDDMNTQFSTLWKASLVGLTTFAVCFAVMTASESTSKISPGPLTACLFTLNKYITTCMAGYFARNFFYNHLSRQLEYAADQYSASFSKSIANGGLETMQEFHDEINRIIPSAYMANDVFKSFLTLHLDHPLPEDRAEQLKCLIKIKHS